MPAPIGPYTPVVRAGDWIVTSGQIGLRNGALVEGVAAQTTQALTNARDLLESQGASLSDVVKTLVFLQDMGDFTTMNGAYAAAFGDHRPARSAVEVAALPLGALVEVECWAYVPAAG